MRRKERKIKIQILGEKKKNKKKERKMYQVASNINQQK